MDYILDNVHLSELFNLVESIQRRKNDEALLMLAIIQNPYAEDPGALVKELTREELNLVSDDTLDREGLNRLKNRLKKESKLIQVKNGTR